ncbi:MAG: OmpA family protein [candidate division Zixibacteria bacterium]|nr:OmpA family protein [candidate division Zixibacteria bacterium]
MKRPVTLSVLLVVGLSLLLLAGCASKGYVNKTVAEEHAKAEASISAVQQEAEANKVAIERLQTLAAQIEKKADLAINKAKGFEDYQILWEGEIYFDFNSSEITTAAREILDQAGQKMTADKSSVMEIGGYCDPVGSQEYNLTLGDRRASATKFYLVDDYGVNLFRLFLVSYGSKKAQAGLGDGSNSSTYAKQRKVTLKLWGKPQTTPSL